MKVGSSWVRTAVGIIATVLVGGALALATGSVAQAKGEYHYWNSSSNPLVVTGYGSTAKAFGQWRVADSAGGTRSFFDSDTWYSNADDHKKYSYFQTWTSTGICIQPDYTSCTAQFFFYDDAETSHSNVGSWQWLYANTDIPASGNSAKAGIIKVCLDVPLRADPCSGGAATTGSNY